MKFPDVRFTFTYGSATKCTRNCLNIEKSHANDAYCIGDYQPKHRCRTEIYKKERRNDRVLESFYDAVYLDRRDGSKKKAAQLGSNRTKRNTHLEYQDAKQFR